MSRRNGPDYRPKYQIIKDDIIDRIRRENLKPDQALESLHQLERAYGFGWSTVHRAVSELVLEGVLYTRRGLGTFVASNASQLSVLLLHALPDWRNSLVEMMIGIREAAQRRSLTLSYIDLPAGLTPNYDFNNHILITPALADVTILRKAHARGQRFVILGSDFPEAPELACVNAATKQATVDAIRHMIKLGHRAIGFVGLIDAFPDYRRGIEGYLEALGGAGVTASPDWILARKGPEPDIGDRLGPWLADHPELTALFVADYTSMVAVLRALQKLNLRVPDDISVISMDEPSTPLAVEANLTCVVQPFQKLGRDAVDLLVEGQQSERISSQTKLLPCTFIERTSVTKFQRERLRSDA